MSSSGVTPGGIGNQPIIIPAGPNNGGGLTLTDPQDFGLVVQNGLGSVGVYACDASYIGVPTAVGKGADISEYTVYTIDADVHVKVRLDGDTVMGAGVPGGVETKANGVTSMLYLGTGAPVNANGQNGDVYIRFDGAALSTMYQRRAGAWVGIV